MTSRAAAQVVVLAERRAAVQAQPLPPAAAPAPPRPRIALWVGASLALHAAALALPGAWFARPEPPLVPPTLELVLVSVPAAAPAAVPAAPARSAPVEPAPAPEAEARPAVAPPKPPPRAAQAVKPAPTRKPPPQAPAPAAAPPEPVAPAPAAPEPSPPVASSATAPAAAPAPAVASGPQAAAPGSVGLAREAPLTPPSFSADYLHNPRPAYPLSARRLGQSGLVVLRVRVSEAGRPTEVRVARSAGFDALDRAALDAVQGWTFVPARRGDTPVAAWVEVPVRFRLEDAR